MIGQFLNMGRKLIMKIFQVRSAQDKTVIDRENEKLKRERMEREALTQRIRAMDMEIHNIGRRRK